MADNKLAYAADIDLTITLTSLASDANLLAGRESTAVANTTTKYLDFLLSGKATTGTTPTDVRQIEVWAYAQIDDTPTYPDVLAGTDANRTILSKGIKNAILKLLIAISTNNTSDRTYPWGPFSLAALFGGSVPERWGVFVTHNTAAALKSTAGDQAVVAKPVFATVG